MKQPFSIRSPAFDAGAINDTIQRALASAGLDTTSGPLQGLTDTIRRALDEGRVATAPGAAPRATPQGWPQSQPQPQSQPPRQPPRQPTRQPQPPPQTGSMSSHEFSNEAGRRAYKLHVPAGMASAPRALVVMLHGCTQSADDFAAGTQMNRLADEQGFIVVYPEQTAQANASRCWNWFNPQDQRRDAGEPSLIAGITRQVAQRHGADPRRIFVAGLSAGAAMALVLGESYPELFAGVGVHSGLPYGSAHDIPSALAAMKGGRSGMPGLKNAQAASAGRRRKVVNAVPVIVFHGDRDHTVQPTNAAQIVQEACEAHTTQGSGIGLQASTHTGVAPGGRRFTRTVHSATLGQAPIEHWSLHGAGHAWSGGHASGSYTDSTGPDASAEMVRFFMALPGGGSA